MPIFVDPHLRKLENKVDSMGLANRHYPNTCPCGTYDPVFPDSNDKCTNHGQPLPNIDTLNNNDIIGDYYSYSITCRDRKSNVESLYQRPVVAMFNLGNNFDRSKMDDILKDRNDDIIINTTSLIGLAMKRDDDEGLGIFHKKYATEL